MRVKKIRRPQISKFGKRVKPIDVETTPHQCIFTRLFREIKYYTYVTTCTNRTFPDRKKPPPYNGYSSSAESYVFLSTALVDLDDDENDAWDDNEMDYEERLELTSHQRAGRASSRSKKKQAAEVWRALKAILKRLIMNPFPSTALIYRRRVRTQRNLVALSIGMAQEIIWIVLRERFWGKVKRYFKKSATARDFAVQRISKYIDKTLCVRFFPKLVESQIYLIHALVIRPGNEFEDVYRTYFTNIRRFYNDVVQPLISKNACYSDIVTKTDTALEPALDDDSFYITDARLSAAGCSLFNYHRDKDMSSSLNFHYPPGCHNYDDKLAVPIVNFRYCIVKRSEFPFDEGEEMAENGHATSTRELGFEEIFSLGSSPNPTQLIVDVRSEKVTISSSMCQELCWNYAPILQPRRLRKRLSEIAKAMYTCLSLYYVGFSLKDVEESLRFLSKYLKAERSRGLTSEEAMSIERRVEIFEQKSRPYRLLNRKNIGRLELCRTLLQSDNPSNDDVLSAMSELVFTHQWSISEVLHATQPYILEWRHQLLKQDWPSVVNGLTRGRKRVSFPHRGQRIAFCLNLTRLLTELIRINFTNKGDESKSLPEAIRDTVAAGPTMRRTLEKMYWNLSVAFWFLGQGSVKEALECLDQRIGVQQWQKHVGRRYDAKLRQMYKKLVELQQILVDGGIGDRDQANVLWQMRADLMEYSGACGFVDCTAAVFNRVGRPQQAVETVEDYLKAFPDDLSVYEMAINRFDQETAIQFAALLIEKAEWHPLITDGCQYALDQPDASQHASMIAVKLICFLDYGKNKDNSDAWALLALALSMIKDTSDQAIVDEWNERKTWWKKFHLRKTKDVDEKLNSLKKEVLDTLERFERRFTPCGSLVCWQESICSHV